MSASQPHLDWQGAFHDFLPGRQARAVPLGNRGGFSGAAIWRVECENMLLCLKAWPEALADVNQLESIHALTSEARRIGLNFVPEVRARPTGATWTRRSNRYWDLVGWMPGAADFHRQQTVARLAAAAIAVGQIHSAWQGSRSTGPCPSIARRLEALVDWNRLIASGWQLNAGDLPESSWGPLLIRAGELVNVTAPRLQAMLAIWQDKVVPLQPVIGDTWHDHILFQGDTVSGVIDYGALRIDHVSADLGRLLGSLIADDEAGWASALSAYRSVRPFSWEDESLARLLDRTGVIVGLINWLRWCGHGERTFRDSAAVTARLQSLVERVEKWSDMPRIVGE